MACIDLDAGAGIRLYKVGIIVTAIPTSTVYPGCTVELGSNNTALVIVRHLLRYRAFCIDPSEERTDCGRCRRIPSGSGWSSLPSLWGLTQGCPRPPVSTLRTAAAAAKGRNRPSSCAAARQHLVASPLPCICESDCKHYNPLTDEMRVDVVTSADFVVADCRSAM